MARNQVEQGGQSSTGRKSGAAAAFCAGVLSATDSSSLSLKGTLCQERWKYSIQSEAKALRVAQRRNFGEMGVADKTTPEEAMYTSFRSSLDKCENQPIMTIVQETSAPLKPVRRQPME
eukprot:2835017-Prorocentrum_lima.AAC.1